MNGTAMSTDSRPSFNSKSPENSGPSDAFEIKWILRMQYKAPFSMPTAISTPAGDGASRYASGFHVCIGARPALVPYPINANTTPSRRVKGCSSGATCMKRVQLRGRITPQISGAVGGGQQTDESAEHEHQRRQPVHSQRVRESRWDVAPKELVRRCHAQAKREREAADQGRLVEFARAAQGSNRGRDERNTECPDEEVPADRQPS